MNKKESIRFRKSVERRNGSREITKEEFRKSPLFKASGFGKTATKELAARRRLYPGVGNVKPLVVQYDVVGAVGEKPDMVNSPPHYNKSPATCKKCGASIECIQVVRHMKCNIANATKYLWRCDLKNDAIEDLKKAIWYIQDEIAERERVKAKG